ncbi:hypothetical protein PVAP13_5NG632031 [Panicum virgatum]|uniref:Uncharacterized protein n=1 Tax=Panicum virgatum TaxID=38727 RepID=A0A8T0S332_PANVG|nr:hypothetical protein PVAP13_5NG632031 [Panicum virgatum]
MYLVAGSNLDCVHNLLINSCGRTPKKNLLTQKQPERLILIFIIQHSFFIVPV